MGSTQRLGIEKPQHLPEFKNPASGISLRAKEIARLLGRFPDLTVAQAKGLLQKHAQIGDQDV